MGNATQQYIAGNRNGNAINVSILQVGPIATQSISRAHCVAELPNIAGRPHIPLYGMCSGVCGLGVCPLKIMSRGLLVLTSENFERRSSFPVSVTTQVPTAMIDEFDSQSVPEQTAPTTQLASSDDEAVLFRHFPGFLYSERTRERSGWVWDYGYDITKTAEQKFERKWVCKRCIQIRSPKVRGLAEKGTDNMMNHLFLKHGQCAPEGKTRGSAQKAAEKKATKNPTSLQIQRTIAEAFQLDTEDPKEQRVANIFIKSFDRQHFQRLVVEWIIHGNRPFTEPECPRLRAIF